MFDIKNRRYTGAKTKLLSEIEKCVNLALQDLNLSKNLSFFDVFGGTGVVSEYFMKNENFTHFAINDFLYSNFAIYQGFFGKGCYDMQKLENLCDEFNKISLKNNYYSDEFGDKFFSKNDAMMIGQIREKIDKEFAKKTINQKEFYILLSSLLYSCDKIANTVGHYEAYRKNAILSDKFKFELILPVHTNAKIEIYRQDSNELVKKLNMKFSVAFVDPPYNSRQYSRFYHFLETLCKNDKPVLGGVARKPKCENMSEYCTSRANLAFYDLIKNLARISKIIVVTYNNTYTSNSTSSQNKISLGEVENILSKYGKVINNEILFKPFSSGKTDLNSAFKNHKENIFICKVGK